MLFHHAVGETVGIALNPLGAVASRAGCDVRGIVLFFHMNTLIGMADFVKEVLDQEQLHESDAIGWIFDGMVEGEEGDAAKLVVAAECPIQGIFIAPVIYIELSIFFAIGHDLVGRIINGDGHPEIVVVIVQKAQNLFELEV